MATSPKQMQQTHPFPIHETIMDQLVLTYLKKRGFNVTEEQLNTIKNADRERVISLQAGKKLPAAITNPTDNTQTNDFVSSRTATDMDIGSFAMNLQLDAHTSILHTLLTMPTVAPTPQSYTIAYTQLLSFILASLEVYLTELQFILWPIYVHTFFILIQHGFYHDAHVFLREHRDEHERKHVVEWKELSQIENESQLQRSDVARIFNSRKYDVQMSAFSHQLLITFLEENGLWQIMRILLQHVYIKINSRRPWRADQSGDLAGSNTAAIPNNISAMSAKWGAFPQTVGIQQAAVDRIKALLREERMKIHEAKEKKEEEEEHRGKKRAAENEEDDEEMDDGKKRKKNKKYTSKREKERVKEAIEEECERLAKEQVAIFEQVSPSKIELPPLKEPFTEDYIRDLTLRARLSASSLPSIAMFTVLNSQRTLTATELSTEGSLVANGFSDSSIRLWDLYANKYNFAAMVDNEEDLSFLNSITPEASETHSNSNTFTIPPYHPPISSNHSSYTKLIGHSAEVHGLSFSYDQMFLLSSSADTSVRLWHVPTATNLVVYKGHTFPVWDVSFSPVGYYWATASHDRTARVWSTDKIYPLRMMVGHQKDVDLVRFHPNCNYIATASSDHTSRLWDIQTGECVRILLGHGSPVTALSFSPQGLTVATGSEDGMIMLWDLGSGRCISSWDALSGNGHQARVTSLDWNVDGDMLASGSLDGTIKLWAPTRASATLSNGQSTNQAFLQTFMTKNTPVTKVRFTPRNLLLSVGAFHS